jgi:hypothetical protein
MQTILAERLKEVTLEYRRIEKAHFTKVQEIHGNTTSRQVEDSKTEEELAIDGEQCFE